MFFHQRFIMTASERTKERTNGLAYFHFEWATYLIISNGFLGEAYILIKKSSHTEYAPLILGIKNKHDMLLSCALSRNMESDSNSSNAKAYTNTNSFREWEKEIRDERTRKASMFDRQKIRYGPHIYAMNISDSRAQYNSTLSELAKSYPKKWLHCLRCAMFI